MWKEAGLDTLDDWTRLVVAEFELDPGYDRDLILDLTRTVAHEVARPAAPLTAFLVGVAAGRQDGSPEQVRAAAERVAALAKHYERRELPE